MDLAACLGLARYVSASVSLPGLPGPHVFCVRPAKGDWDSWSPRGGNSKQEDWDAWKLPARFAEKAAEISCKVGY